MAQTTCSIDECDRPRKSRGWCKVHYTRWWRYGDPLTQKVAANGELLAWLNAALSVSTDQCQEWPFATTKGYGVVRFAGRSGRATHAALILSGHPRPDPPSDQVLHSCDNPPCINPRHLRWGTNADNSGDMVERDRTAWGERHGLHRLTADDVQEVRRLRREGQAIAAIADKFGVCSATVGHILSGRNWSNLPDAGAEL